MEAVFESICSSCNKRVRPGAEITMRGDKWVHARCPTDGQDQGDDTPVHSFSQGVLEELKLHLRHPDPALAALHSVRFMNQHLPKQQRRSA